MEAEADPMPSWGRPKTQKTQGKKQQKHSGTAGAWGHPSEERFAEITSGRSRWQPGLVATGKDSSNEAQAEGEESQRGLAHESAVATTEG